MLKNKAFTLIEILIVVAIVAILATLVAPSVIRSRITTNETLAQAHLNTIATAIENYSMAHNGYPNAVTLLTSGTPPYLNNDFFASPRDGYQFTATVLNTGGYAILAAPVNNTTDGHTSFTISTGFLLRANP